jgi:hypothetical protein
MISGMSAYRYLALAVLLFAGLTACTKVDEQEPPEKVDSFE